ncbi:MAG: hypothetical protein U5K43_05120 [Halofilum sp. (in: g-proteobacteria)]|nr:hypothetical protein [Halofilum sp. (in: g-proteobacteria)]
MTAPELDLRPLVLPGLAVVMAAGLLGLTVALADARIEQHARALERARAGLAEASRRQREASREQALHARYAQRFRQMQRRAWIGGGRRLRWIETLQRVNGELLLPRLRYEIGARRALVPAGADLGDGRLRLYHTPMTLTLGALHEGDLLAVLDALAASGGGVPALARCGLARAPGRARTRFRAGSANLDIACVLHWYALELVDPAEAAP